MVTTDSSIGSRATSSTDGGVVQEGQQPGGGTTDALKVGAGVSREDIGIDAGLRTANINRLASGRQDATNDALLENLMKEEADPNVRFAGYGILLSNSTLEGFRRFLRIAGGVCEGPIGESRESDRVFVARLLRQELAAWGSVREEIVTFMALRAFEGFNAIAQEIATVPSVIESARLRCLNDSRFRQGLINNLDQPWAAQLLSRIHEMNPAAVPPSDVQRKIVVDCLTMCRPNAGTESKSAPRRLRAALAHLLEPTAVNVEQEVRRLADSEPLKNFLNYFESNVRDQLLTSCISDPEGLGKLVTYAQRNSWKAKMGEIDGEEGSKWQHVARECSRLTYVLRAEEFIRTNLRPILDRLIEDSQSKSDPAYKILEVWQEACKPLAERSKAAKALLDSVEAALGGQPQS